MDKFKQKVGVLGGGQLGLMLAEAASPLNVEITVLDPSPSPPAKRCASHIQGDFRQAESVLELMEKCDIITFEIEHINVDAVEAGVEAGNGRVVASPTPRTMRMIQDKYEQKVHLASFGIEMPDFRNAPDLDSIIKIAEVENFGYPLMLKSKTLAYDGRGNAVIKCREDVRCAIEKLGGGKVGLYVEKWISFDKELAVMVARGLDGQVAAYPVVETVQKDNICHLVIAPAQIDARAAEKAQNMALEAVSKFDGAGIYGVEMFLLKDGTVLLNEIAPRPHNSGHYTIEGCYTSQFEQHLRCILGLSLGRCDLKVGASIMLNVLGNDSMEETFRVCSTAMQFDGASVHWYGKKECRKARKMGHITITAETMMSCFSVLNKILPSSESEQIKLSPVVGVIMGSDSDLSIMKPCAEILKDFNIPFEITIVSAHRTPSRLVEYAKNAHKKGIKVIIAAAGGAAHLPGMTAALTPIPVIGVPVALKNLDGVDSLHSIVQMPRGVPVATVAINNSTNAALLAIRMLGMYDKSVIHKMIEYQEKMEKTVLEKVDKLNEIGWENYSL